MISKGFQEMDKKQIILTAILSFAILPLAHPAFAQNDPDSWTDRLELDSQLIFQYIYEENPDLTTDAEDTEDSLSEQFQFSAGANITNNLTGFMRARALNINGDSGFDDDTGETETLDETFLELRQLWIRYDHLARIVPLYLQVGRQRLQEPRAIWWNSNNDLIKLSYDGTIYSGFLAAGEDLASYRAGTDEDYEKDDEDRLRILGELSWQYRYDHFLEGRFVYENDYSDLEPVGAFQDADDRDIEDNNALWAGARVAGTYVPDNTWLRIFKYRADLIGLVGEVDEIQSITVNENTRQVTGSTNRDLRAWAFDSNVILFPEMWSGPAFTLGYAFASGDDDPDDDTDNAFRQTDLEGNSSRIGLERKQQRNYGEVLRPELSNLHILSAGIDVPVTEYSDVSLTYFYYHLDEEATDLRSDGITARMNGTDKSVGQAADFIVNVGLGDEIGYQTKFIDGVDFRFVAGSFFPGDAYNITGDDNVYRFFTELRFRF